MQFVHDKLFLMKCSFCPLYFKQTGKFMMKQIYSNVIYVPHTLDKKAVLTKHIRLVHESEEVIIPYFHELIFCALLR